MFNELVKLYQTNPEFFDEESSNFMEILLILDSLKRGVIPALSLIGKQEKFLIEFLMEKIYVVRE